MISLRRSLLIRLLSGLLLVGTLAGAATWWKAQDEVGEMFDDQLRQIALSLHHRIPSPGGPAPQMIGTEREDAILVQVWGPGGALLFDSRPHERLRLYPGQGFRTVTSGQGREWRVLTEADDGRTIQVAQAMSARWDMSAAFALGVMTPLLALIPLLGLMIWLAVGRALQPLRRIARDLEGRGAGALDPLGLDRLPGEVRPLVQALNDLLRRLTEALDAQGRFIADAAHALRTPLAAVQLQSQVAERAGEEGERRAAMAQLQGGIRRASHLVQQLLDLARQEPARDAARGPAPGGGADGALGVTQVVGTLAPLAEERGVDLGVVAAESAMLACDNDSFRILVENLVDNAIRYTPAGGSVDVGLWREAKTARLEVADTGPGIPESLRLRVFDRFYRRGGSDSPGSGLGLAIVSAIVERQGGTVALEDGAGGRGLKVVLRLPLAS